MASKLLLVLIGIFASCNACQVSSKTFTTQDATIVTTIAYISEFTISNCASGTPKNLYAVIDGNVLPVSVLGPNKYQVSWTEETKSARSGDRIVPILDEEAYTAFRKAARAGEDTSSIEPLVDVIVNHPGAFNGPWLKSEFLATCLSIVVAYVAISSRSKLSA